MFNHVHPSSMNLLSKAEAADRLMKAQLKVAEEAAGKAAEVRAEVELRLQKAQQDLQTTMAPRTTLVESSFDR